MLSPDMAFSARDRLLPPSVPFRFFAAALGFHAIGWLLLALSGDALAGSRGGPGAVLAALHLFTLGTLATTAMGAAYQLLPMATVRPVGSVFWAKISFWLVLPGIALLTTGMAMPSHALACAGGVLALLGFLVFAVLLVDNLRSAREMPVVHHHAWAALVCLAVTVGLGVTLLADLQFGFLPDHRSFVGVHLGIALYGFMGMLAAGFSTILVPMLALGPAPPVRLGHADTLIGVVALVLLVIGSFTAAWLTIAAVLVGLLAAAVHLYAMNGVMRGRMRKRLGTPFLLIRVAWVMLPLSLIAALALAAGIDRFNAPAVFVILAVGGWLLTFLFGVLQRIMPFLASVHVTAPDRRPPLVSALTPAQPARAHAVLHLLAIALLVTGNLLGIEWIARAGTLSGLGAAIALIIFAAEVRTRALKALHGASQQRIPVQAKPESAVVL